MIKSFRLRLTAWYLAFFSLLFVLFGIFLYGILSRDLQTRLDETLLSQAATTASLFLDEMQEVHGDQWKSAAEAVSEMRLRGSTVAVFDGSRMLSSSAPVVRADFEAIAAQAQAAGAPDLCDLNLMPSIAVGRSTASEIAPSEKTPRV